MTTGGGPARATGGDHPHRSGIAADVVYFTAVNASPQPQTVKCGLPYYWFRPAQRMPPPLAGGIGGTPALARCSRSGHVRSIWRQ